MKLAPALLFLLSLSLFAMQRGGFRGFGGYDYGYGGPSVPSEFYWSRLQYTSSYAGGASYGYRRFGGGWSRDYPKADNDCLIALRRLTRINSPSPLNVADLDSDHIFDYPWIYAVDVNTWTFTDAEAKRLHDYLYKGRLPDGGRLPRHRRLAAFHGRHAPGAARPARRGSQG